MPIPRFAVASKGILPIKIPKPIGTNSKGSNSYRMAKYINNIPKRTL